MRLLDFMLGVAVGGLVATLIVTRPAPRDPDAVRQTVPHGDVGNVVEFRKAMG